MCLAELNARSLINGLFTKESECINNLDSPSQEVHSGRAVIIDIISIYGQQLCT